MKNCTRFFTQELIDEIRMRLAAIQGAKDSQFDKATYIDSNDQIAIIQLGKNKRADIEQIREKLFVMDDTPIQGSDNPVTSNGIYEYILNVIESVLPGDALYLYIRTDSEMFDYLIHGTGGTYQQSIYDGYCQQVYDALVNNYFIIIDNAICVGSYDSEDLEGFDIHCISNSKYISIGARKENGVWHKLSSTVVTTERYLIDNKYLRDNKYINQDTLTLQLTFALSSYLTLRDLQRITDNYPTLNSSNYVTSNGVWEAILNVINSVATQDGVLILSNDMVQTLVENTNTVAFGEYCEIIFDACKKGMLLVFEDGICKYTIREDGGIRSFEFYVITTRNTYSICGLKNDNIQGNIWSPYRNNVIIDNHLLATNELNTTLLSYYTKGLVDALLANMYLTVNLIRDRVNTLRTDYDSRMEETPKYHKANWLIDEVDLEGRVTEETSEVLPANRFNSMWWAVKRSKLITLYGVPDIYRESNIIGDDPDLVDNILVRFLLNGLIVTYEIEKKYVDNIQTPLNLYLQVTRTDDSIGRVNTIMTKEIDSSYSSIVVGTNVNKYTIYLGGKLDEFNSFGDIGSILDIPLIMDDSALNIEPFMCDLKVVRSSGLILDKRDFNNLAAILGFPSLTLYGNRSSDTQYVFGNFNFLLNEDDDLVLNYNETNYREPSSILHTLVLNQHTSNAEITAFLNSIFSSFSIIKDTKALCLILATLQCTIEFGGITEESDFFVKTDTTYKLSTPDQVSFLEIEEL